MKELDIFNLDKRHVMCKTNEIIKGYRMDDPSALKTGEIYHLDYIEVYNYYTFVYLEEFPGQQFNSVRFLEITLDEE